MANVYGTVWASASSTAEGDPIQYLTAVIGGANSEVVIGSGRKRMRVRLYAEADAWVKWGASPTATGASDSMALGLNNPEYVDIEVGHVITAITR